MKHIVLTKGYVAFIDDEDYERINRRNWFASVGLQVRAARMQSRQMVYMHHEVLEVMPWDLNGREVDHIDRNPLNNMKGNLRFVTRSENMRNTRSVENKKGYTWNHRAKSYMVYLDTLLEGSGTKRTYLGYRKTIEGAKQLLAEAKANASN